MTELSNEKAVSWRDRCEVLGKFLGARVECSKYGLDQFRAEASCSVGFRWKSLSKNTHPYGNRVVAEGKSPSGCWKRLLGKMSAGTEPWDASKFLRPIAQPIYDVNPLNPPSASERSFFSRPLPEKK